MENDKALAPAEQRELDRHERIIGRSISSFMDVGESLLEIRDKALWRGDYQTFEHYCDVKWSFTARRARQLITSAKVVKNLAGDPKNATNGNSVSAPGVVDLSERAVQEVAKVPETKQAEVVKEATKKAGGKAPTAKQVREAAEEAAEPKAKAPRLDSAGNAIPPNLVADFDDGRMVEAMGHVSAVRKIVKEIAEGRLGTHINPSDFKATADHLWEIFKFAQPYAVHHACKGKGCKDCQKLGWLTKAHHDIAAKAGTA